MSTHTVRISNRTHDELRDLARTKQYGRSMQAVIDYAVEELRRKRFFDEANAAFASLQEDEAAYQEYMDEQEQWENTISDGLDEDGLVMEAEHASGRS